MHETRIAQQLRSQTYVLLNGVVRRISTHFDVDTPPVAVIDVSNLKTESDATTAEPYTPPLALVRIIESITTKHTPKSIAVDIDLSPVFLADGQHVPSGFLELMLLADKLEKKGTPVFFGVDRSVGYGPQHWLRDEQWARHAAWLRIPLSRQFMIPVELESRDWNTGADKVRLPSLAAAAAGWSEEAHGPETRPASGFVNWTRGRMTELEDEELIEGKLTVQLALSDLGWVERLKSAIIVCDEKGVIPDVLLTQESVQQKMVFIGKVAKSLDQFQPSGFERTVPGVLLHAAGAITLAQVSPLRVLSHMAGAVAGFLGMVVILGVHTLLNRRQKEESAKTVAHDIRAGFVYNGVWAAILVVVGVLLVLFAHVLWMELLFVLVFLVLHMLLECLLMVQLVLSKPH